MKKILSLTNVFIKEYYQNLPVFDNTKKKFNKKSIFFWLIAIVFLGSSYVSYAIIKFLADIGQAQIFLNIYFPILMGFLAFQSILACANIFFFSKDIENVLHMPIKPIELLIAKLNTVLFMLYASEAMITIVPLALYGMLTSASFIYYFWAILITAIFPVFIAVIVGILTLLVMRISKFIKNKDIFQIITTIVFIILIFLAEFFIINTLFNFQSNEETYGKIINTNEKMQEISKYFLIINPAINILIKPVSIQALFSFIKIIFYNLISIIIFITIGIKTYLKDILNNIVSVKKYKKNNIKIKIESKSIARAYISKEIKILIRQPVFFMQCIFPVVTLLISAVILVVGVYPIILHTMQDEQLKNAVNNMSINTEIICDILIILQVLFSISNISLTAISREGKNASFIKYIPVELYKQFIYKNIPQFVLNMLITIVVLVLIWFIVPTIEFIYVLSIFGIATIINAINCYLMLIVDLRRPNLDWQTEDAVVKRSENKLFQYALMIINVLVLLYIATIFKEINVLAALGLEILFFFIILVIIDRCVKKWQNKLFNKIE